MSLVISCHRHSNAFVSKSVLGYDLLRKSGWSYDADTLTWYNDVVAAGGAGEWGATSAARTINKRALDTLVKGLKAESLWTGLKIRLFAGTNTIAGGLASGVGGTVTNNLFTSGDINILTGWKGNASTKYLTTDWASDANGQNDFSVGVYVTQAVAGAGFFFGIQSGPAAGAVALGQAGGPDALFSRGKNTVASTPAGQIANVNQTAAISRIASNNYMVLINGGVQTIAANSDGNLPDTYQFFAKASTLYSGCRISAIWTTKGLTSAQLITFNSLLAAYHSSIRNEFDNIFLRPDGISNYYRPDGSSLYQRF